MTSASENDLQYRDIENAKCSAFAKYHTNYVPDANLYTKNDMLPSHTSNHILSKLSYLFRLRVLA